MFKSPILLHFNHFIIDCRGRWKVLLSLFFLLVLPRNALFCKGFWGYGKMLWNYRLWQIRAELSKLLLPVSSKIGSKRDRITTKDFQFTILLIIKKAKKQFLTFHRLIYFIFLNHNAFIYHSILNRRYNWPFHYIIIL